MASKGTIDMLKLKSERLRRGWTQTTLSAFTGIAQSDLSAIENGHRRAGAGQRRRLALAFGLPSDYLFATATADEPAKEAR